MLEDAAADEGAVELARRGDGEAVRVERREVRDRVGRRRPVLGDEDRAEPVAEPQQLALAVERALLAVDRGELLDPLAKRRRVLSDGLVGTGCEAASK